MNWYEELEFFRIQDGRRTHLKARYRSAPGAGWVWLPPLEAFLCAEPHLAAPACLELDNTALILFGLFICGWPEVIFLRELKGYLVNASAWPSLHAVQTLWSSERGRPSQPSSSIPLPRLVFLFLLPLFPLFTDAPILRDTLNFKF